MIHFAGVCVNVRKWYHAITFFAGEFVSLSVQGMILCYNGAGRGGDEYVVYDGRTLSNLRFFQQQPYLEHFCQDPKYPALVTLSDPSDHCWKIRN